MSARKPAVQTHAGLYSNFTPSVAAVDHPHPKTFAEAKRAALDVLSGQTPTSPSISTGYEYPGYDYYPTSRNSALAAQYDSPPSIATLKSVASEILTASEMAALEAALEALLLGEGPPGSSDSTEYRYTRRKGYNHFGESLEASYAPPVPCPPLRASEKPRHADFLGSGQLQRTGGSSGKGKVVQTGGSAGKGSMSEDGVLMSVSSTGMSRDGIRM